MQKNPQYYQHVEKWNKKTPNNRNREKGLRESVIIIVVYKRNTAEPSWRWIQVGHVWIQTVLLQFHRAVWCIVYVRNQVPGVWWRWAAPDGRHSNNSSVQREMHWRKTHNQYYRKTLQLFQPFNTAGTVSDLCTNLQVNAAEHLSR